MNERYPYHDFGRCPECRTPFNVWRQNDCFCGFSKPA